ncbi:unnamed protein product [Arctia plantaginis]|uniref:Uncharacterized protein n=1 Tax=Arctia plantaginis TaxID=874455 RepID=A0A8S1BGB2_ARCPL|nr:unnamed protein product [Arctia plantaginis]
MCNVKPQASPEISEYLKPSSGRRDVNFTLETIFEINHNDAADVRALENAKNLINSVKRAFLQNTVQQQRNNSETEVSNNMTFSDFCQKVIAVIYRYDDSDLKDFVAITSDEIKNYHYRGCKFHELAENMKLRKYFDQLQEINKHKSAGDIKKILNTVDKTLKDKNLDIYKRGFIDAVNDLYKADTVVKFNKFLTNIEDYRQNARRNMDLVKIIRSGIRSIIFDHYTDLSDQERSQFTSKLGDFFSYYMGMSRAVVQMNTDMNNQSMRYKTIKRIVTETKWKAHRTIRPTVTPHNYFKQMYVEKNLDLKYYPDASYNYNTKDNTMYDSETPKSTNKPVIEVITMRPYISKRVMTSQKLRYEIHFKSHDIELKRPKLHLKKPEFQIKLPGSHVGRHKVHISRPNELPEMNAPMFKYNKLMYLNGKIPANTEESKETEHKQNTRNAKEKFVRSSREDRKPSNQRFLLPYRKSFENTSVLNRLNYLENELRIAKTRIKNDSAIIRDLNNIIRVSGKTDHDLNTNNSEFLLSGDNNDQTDNKEKKDAVIDLNINPKDFKNLISLEANEILRKLNLVKDDNIYPNKGEKTIIRKFDFDKTEYNQRNKDNFDSKEKKKEFTSIKTQRDTNTKYSTKPQRGYLSDGDTYERVEERIYDSDSKNYKPNVSDKGKGEKLSNFKDVTKNAEKRTVFATNDKINGANERQYDYYSTLKNDRDNRIGRSEQYTLSDSGNPRIDEGKTSVSMKNVNNNLNTQHTTEIIKSIYYAGNREQRKQKDIENYYFNKANHNLSKEYNAVKMTHTSTDLGADKYKKGKEESYLKFKTDKRYTIYSSDSQRYESNVERKNEDSFKTNMKPKRFRVTQAEENLHPFGENHSGARAVTKESHKSFKNDKPESKLDAQKTTKNQIVEMVEKRKENVNFVRTVAPSEVHPKRYVVANHEVEKPKSEKVNLITAVIPVSPLISNRRRIEPKKRTF